VRREDLEISVREGCSLGHQYVTYMAGVEAVVLVLCGGVPGLDQRGPRCRRFNTHTHSTAVPSTAWSSIRESLLAWHSISEA
jgi:hypothetical protein